MLPLGPLDPFKLAGTTGRGLSGARRRLQPDHSTIQRRAVRFSAHTMVLPYLYVLVSPSRSAPRDYDSGQTGRAFDFAQAAFPGVFPKQPAAADRDHTRFSVEDDRARQERALIVHRSGLVELLWASLPAPGTEQLLDLEEVSAVLMRLARAVAGPEYVQISRAGRGLRRFAKLDWNLYVSARSRVDDDLDVSWGGFRFADDTPPRANHNWFAAPPDGYGSPDVVNLSRRTQPEQIAAAFLERLISENGYSDYESAIAETLKGAGACLLAPRIGSATAAPGTGYSRDVAHGADQDSDEVEPGGPAVAVEPEAQ